MTHWTGAGTRRALRDAAVLLGLALAVGRALGIVWANGYDAHSYWAADLDSLYAVRLAGGKDVFLYSPAFAQLLEPLRGLSFPEFLGLWTALIVAALAFIAGPLTLLVVLLRPVWLELVVGNVNLLIGAAIVLGFRFPAAWSFVLLTKVTPGVGLLWFAVRHEWRSLAVALGATAAIVAVSAALAPWLWVDWFNVLLTNGLAAVPTVSPVQVPLLLRLPIAILVIAWGARGNHRWTLPIGAFLALPVIWESGFSLLVAVLPLIDRRHLREWIDGIRAPLPRAASSEA